MWRVFIIHVSVKAFADASSGHGDWEHVTLLFRAESGVLRDSSAVKVQKEERTNTRALPKEATGRPRDRRLVGLFSASSAVANLQWHGFGKIRGDERDIDDGKYGMDDH